MADPLAPPASSAAARTLDLAAPRPVLGVLDAMAIVVGTVVGAGIFRVPSVVAAHAESTAVMLLAWVLGGAVSLVGALCYAELAAAYPHAGGDYHYLARAYGRRLAFFFGWARLGVIQTGSIALLAFIIGDYAAGLLPGAGLAPWAWAALAIVLLTALNVAGVRQGARTQNVLTAAEVLGLVALATLGFLARPAAAAPALGDGAGTAFGLVMVFVLLTYGGWNEGGYVSAEVRDPGRHMARVLVGSILVVTVLYVLVNAAYAHALGLGRMARSSTVAADLVAQALDPRAAALVSALVVVSATTSANAAIFTGARSAWALGRDFALFRALGRWHPRLGTPVNALVLQGALALGLVALGAVTRRGFETMVEYTAPVFWFFFLLAGVALFVLRRLEPDAPRPFRVPLYPLTPLLFCASSAYLLYSSLAYTGVGALVGVAVLLVGVPLLWIGDRHA